MFNNNETSAIMAAATTGDHYAWTRVIATLAECDPSELDGQALFAAIDSSRIRGAPPEANAVRALDAAGALVRAQFAFAERDAARFEDRFAEARFLLDTRAAAAGVEVPDPAPAARHRRLILRPKQAAASGCAPTAIPLVFIALLVAGLLSTVSIRFGKDVVSNVKDAISTPFAAAAPNRFGLPPHRLGVAIPIVWRAVVGADTDCRYAVGRTGQEAPVEQAVVSRPTPARSVAVHVGPGEALYASGCTFMPASPPTPGSTPYEGDYIVGVDIPAGRATVSAGNQVCRVRARRYVGGTPTEMAAADLIPRTATVIELRPDAGGPVVLNVRSCNVAVA